MKKILWVTFTLFLIAPLKGEEFPDLITIELQKESYLKPVYIENTFSSSTKLPQDYLQEIESILRFNFEHNGRTRVMSQKDIGDGSYKHRRKAEEWQMFGVDYVFKLSLADHYLTVSVLSTKLDEIRFAEEIKLTQNLDKDRENLHKLSMHLHKALFNEEGIYQNKLLFTLKSKNALFPSQPWISEIYQCDWDGGNTRQVTDEKNYCVTPSYMEAKAPHGKNGYFYVSYKIGQPKIFWSTFKEKEAKRLTYLRGNQLMPCISPTGNQVAFINDAPGNPELFVQDFNPSIGAVGKPKQIFSCKKGVQASPTYSPDGKRIAFVSNKDGCPRIYVMDVPQNMGDISSKKPTVISRKNRENTKPCWSPDGSKIAYIAMVEGVRQVWIYDFNQDKEWQLTKGPGNKENPVWAFNSLHLVFNSVGNASCELYLVNLNQPKAVRIKPINGIKRFPVWVHNLK